MIDKLVCFPYPKACVVALYLSTSFTCEKFMCAAIHLAETEGLSTSHTSHLSKLSRNHTETLKLEQEVEALDKQETFFLFFSAFE